MVLQLLRGWPATGWHRVLVSMGRKGCRSCQRRQRAFPYRPIPRALSTSATTSCAAPAPRCGVREQRLALSTSALARFPKGLPAHTQNSFGVHAITTAGSYDIVSIRAHISHLQRERDRAIMAASGKLEEQPPVQYCMHELPSDLCNSALLVSVHRGDATDGASGSAARQDVQQQGGDKHPRQQSPPKATGTGPSSASTIRNKAFILSSGSIVFWSMPREDMRLVRELCRQGELHPIKDERVIEEEHEILHYRAAHGDQPSTIERGTIFLSTNGSVPRSYTAHMHVPADSTLAPTADAAQARAEPHQPAATTQHAEEQAGQEGQAEEEKQQQQEDQGEGSGEDQGPCQVPTPTATVLKHRPVYSDMFAFSHALANSVELGILETELNAYARKVESIPETIKDGTPLRLSRPYVLQRYGELLTLRHKLNASKDLSNFYWDREHLEALYDRTCSFLDVNSRRRLCNERLNYHSELAELLRITLSEQHSTKLEWYIIGLIAVEVMFELYHVFMR